MTPLQFLPQFAIINFIGVFINRYKAWEKEEAEKKEGEKKAEDIKRELLRDLQDRIRQHLEQTKVGIQALTRKKEKKAKEDEKDIQKEEEEEEVGKEEEDKEARYRTG